MADYPTLSPETSSDAVHIFWIPDTLVDRIDGAMVRIAGIISPWPHDTSVVIIGYRFSALLSVEKASLHQMAGANWDVFIGVGPARPEITAPGSKR